MRLRKTIFVALLSLSLLSGCVWLKKEEDIVTMSPLPQVNNHFRPTTVWRHAVGKGTGAFYSHLHPACYKAHVFAADRHGSVKALDAETGKKIWSTDLAIQKGFFSCKRAARLSGGLTAAGDRVYLGSELAKVYALDARNGRRVWETRVSGEVLSTPVVSDGVVLVHTGNGMLQALHETDGTVKWSVNLDLPPLKLRGDSAPTTAFGTVIVGGNNGLVRAVLINQGQLIWQKRIAKPRGITEIARINDVKSTPLLVNGVVYALAYQGYLAALDLISGQVIWSRDIGSVTNLLGDSGRIYLVDQNDHVIAVNSQDGRSLWQQSELMHRNLTSPVLHKGYIVTGDSEGYLHWINTDDGRFVAQKKVDRSGFLSDPIVAGDKLIVQAKNGQIYAISR
ncbi:outer membrane protein assembly factor BamB [secondary endosymbiont of Ctenarytaina eucalypti]|uniref:Outer membrane protein assembly factor BamB n=1 Tax=secondary endosymbiont of Ctenarytaina eucalypti TaxID=1199245 RepID=J3YSH5_9ENTR|nr:outer membrane protein assembly factor BamB [secondary endosymbiont of Ctenarytaina eucalypti]AFP85213.1 Beta-barrel assembly machine subunit BamB [secondary endosymbiont of Ctenarytaina eucalypti]